MALLKVQDNIHLVRESNSGALINRDKNALDDYMSKRKLFMNQTEELNKVKSELDIIKNDMSEIKQLMLQLIAKG
jgi:hypothetical protein